MGRTSELKEDNNRQGRNIPGREDENTQGEQHQQTGRVPPVSQGA